MWQWRLHLCRSTAAEVVLDVALIQGDGFDLIVGEPHRCWEVTQDRDKASVIENALFENQRGVRTDITFKSYVARRIPNIQQQEDALGTPLLAVVKGCAPLRGARIAEGSCKVVMWTGGSYVYDEVVRALVLLDRLEMRPGKGQSGKTVPTLYDLEADASTVALGS